jgi:hypothetical protein
VPPGVSTRVVVRPSDTASSSSSSSSSSTAHHSDPLCYVNANYVRGCDGATCEYIAAAPYVRRGQCHTCAPSREA